MEAYELRLECIRLAMELQPADEDDAVNMAKAIYDFVCSGEKKAN